jgi:mRNA interferase MazF
MARRITHPLRGEIWLVNFEPTIGAEIRKTRPALVIQNDIGNRASPITIVAAITSTLKRAYPFQVYRAKAPFYKINDEPYVTYFTKG